MKPLHEIGGPGRGFIAVAPNRLWLADLTSVKMYHGCVYVAFIIAGFSRDGVGWQASPSLHTDLALDALHLTLWGRRGQPPAGPVHHVDHGVQ